MNHKTTSFPSQQKTSRTSYNHDGNQHTEYKGGPNVREAARKYEMKEKSNGSSSKPQPRPPPPTKTNNDHANETPTSSLSSLPDSPNSDLVIQRRSHLNEKPTSKSPKTTNVLTKSNISAARINARPPTQQKPTIHRRRTPPPIPTETRQYRKPKQNGTDNMTYVNSDPEYEEHDSYGIHHDTDVEEPASFKAYAKSAPIKKKHQIPSSTQRNENNRSPPTTNGHRLRHEEPPHVKSNQFKNTDVDSIGLEIIEPSAPARRQRASNNGYYSDYRRRAQRAPSIIEDYEASEIHDQHGNVYPYTSHRPPPPAFAVPFLKGEKPPPLPPPLTHHQRLSLEELPPDRYIPKRTCPLSNFLMQVGALLLVFIPCMVLVLALKEENTQLHAVMQVIFTYIYAVSIIWMLWCTCDIISFRRDWFQLTASAQNQEEYMDIAEQHPNNVHYFPDINNTGGLFMRVGAGLLCMGSLILTVIALAKTIAIMGTDVVTCKLLTENCSSLFIITSAIVYIFRIFFHCVQFTFLFRYGNLVIDHYHLLARVGLIHLVIANFCTWFEAIVFETLEEIHKDTPNSTTSSTTSPWSNTTIPRTTTIVPTTDANGTNGSFLYFVGETYAAAAAADSATKNNSTTLEFLIDVESSVGMYLYPCLIEYSLISVTVFFIMWRNVGKDGKQSKVRFGDRHVFTVNCARASRGLLIGGIIFILTILTLIPTYVLNDNEVLITHVTELVLLCVSLLAVCISYVQTTKLYYDRHAHVDVFDKVLILITTVGNFAYSFFGLFALMLQKDSMSELPAGLEMSIGFLAIFQTFLQSSFIMDTLKRRTTSKEEMRNKPGREIITALLLMNLAIWMHDSLSAKKVRFNPAQVEYYGITTWAIIQAFTSPLSIFYRFHSCVCLADIWQEVYHDSGNQDTSKHGKHRLVNTNGGHDN